MRRRISLLLVPGLIAAGLFSGSPAVAQAEPPLADAGPITVLAGYGEADATWHVGAGAGQYSDKSPDNVVNLVSEGDVDPQAHSVAQKDSYGVHSRLSYRAIVVEDADGDHVAFVKSDSYLAQDYLLRRVGQILLLAESKVSYEEIFHMASHNHSSPYYMTPSAGVWIFQDAFDIRAFEYHARAMAEAIMNAEAALKPARMGATTVQHNLFKGMIQRKGPADDGTPRGYPDDFGDLGLSIIRFDNMVDPNNPTPLATMINWGQHPEGLDGHDLITGDYVAPLERFVERATGAPLVFGQGDVGSAEAGPGRPDLVAALGIPPRWSHAGHAQGERGAFLLARDVIKGYNQIADPTANPLVPLSSDFDVEAGNAWVAGPYSHPFPSVSNCRTETTVEGSPAAPGPPECIRAGEPDPSNQMWEELKAEGIYPPDNYPLPSYGGLEENTRLHLQAFKLGDVIVGSCACEAQVDLILNFESRANDIEGDIWDGFDWTTRMDCAQNADTTWTCNKKADEPRPGAVQGPFTVSDYRYKRMLAQVHNDAAGWDAPENIQAAMSEPYNSTDIFGNFTKEELSEEGGYKLAIGVGHAGDYNGYTVSYREYQSWDDYRKSLTSYGPHTADYMVTRMVRLAGTLNGVPNEQLEIDIARGLPDEARQLAMSTALGAVSFATYEAWTNSFATDMGPAEAIPSGQPKDIKRFDAATFTWRGGSNAVDNPVVKVQRRNAQEQWVDFADQSGEIQTRLEFPNGVNAFADTLSGQQEWLWTANFEAFNAFPAEIGSTPEGEYRFVVDGVIRQGIPRVNTGYHLESESFTVLGWDGIEASDLQAGEDTVSFVVPPITYPASYTSVFSEYISTAISDGFCKQCSFRPWAKSGTLESAQVTIVHADGGHSKRAADCEGNTCTAPVGPGETAYVAPGDIVDNYGETNSQCYDFTGRNECPPAENDLDADNDGVFDDADNCVDVANSDQLDTDRDAAGDACDDDDTDGPDPDGDGIRDRDDNCDAEPNTNQSDVDGDSIGDACDPDSSNGPTADPDGDGISNLDEAAGGSDPRDACDPNDTAANCDPDDDGFVNATDNCDQNANPGQTDSDSDGIGDPCDSTPLPPTTGGGDTGGGSGGGSGGGTGGGQSSPPASSPPASNSPAAPDRGTASTSIAASVVTTNHGEDFTLSGVVSGDRRCTFTNVEILKRSYGTDELSSVATAQVAPDGTWTTTLSSAMNASYTARPAATDLCDGQTSTPVDVLVRAKVIPQAMRCDITSTLRGRVAPNLAGTKVVLQRKARGAWKRIDVARLNDRSRFVFRGVPRGCRPTRVIWLKQDIRNERGVASVSLEG